MSTFMNHTQYDFVAQNKQIIKNCVNTISFENNSSVGIFLIKLKKKLYLSYELNVCLVCFNT